LLYLFLLLVISEASAQLPQYDICAGGGDTCSCSGHGLCSGGACRCQAGYSGRDCSVPPNNGWANYRVKPGTPAATYYCDMATGCEGGSCAFGNLKGRLPAGIDGIAAVNPTLYGSRVRPGSAAAGQGCGQCYKLTKGTISKNVVITDRCAGYCKGSSAFICDPRGSFSTHCVQCLAPWGGVNGTLSPPACSCFNAPFNFGKSGAGGLCDTAKTQLCDWCDANDHPHFDLNTELIVQLCSDAQQTGHCILDSFAPITCGPIL